MAEKISIFGKLDVSKQFDATKQPKCKIELHVHLDGSYRLSTAWELAKKKNINLGIKSYEELVEKCQIKQPSTLADFLKPLILLAPVFIDDLVAIERMAYEFCEDSAKQGVIYTEVRYSPHLLVSNPLPQPGVKAKATPEDVVKVVNKGLSQGEKDFNIKVRSILCCIRSFPAWSNDVLQLCIKYKDQGVVGIDIAGDEAACFADPEDVKVFQQAAEKGIHRTAHAGEAGPASNVATAYRDMKVERIGHGYHVLDDKVVYKECIEKGIHFETCPYSSYLTGSVPLAIKKHPIINFAEDNVNISFSRDDAFVIQKTLDEEYSLLRFLGLSDVHFVRANFNAARSCFLPENEKQELIKKLKKVYGIE